MSALQRLGLATNPPPEEARSTTQSQTEEAFGFKWSRREIYGSPVSTGEERCFKVIEIAVFEAS